MVVVGEGGRTRYGAALLLTAALLSLAASSPHGGESGGVVGARRLAQALDCKGVVAFSGVSARPAIRVTNATTPGEEEAVDPVLGTKLGFRDLLTDKSLGWSRESGEFTGICLGLYQFAFSGTGAKFVLRMKKTPHPGAETPSADGEWKSVVSTSDTGGSHVVLLEIQRGDVIAVWMAPGGHLPKDDEGTRTSFSGYRISKPY